MKAPSIKGKIEALAWGVGIFVCAILVLSKVPPPAQATTPPPVVRTSSISCKSESIVTTIAYGGKPYVLRQAIVCTDGTITLKGRRAKK
jgi:hypothetical protein